MARDDLSSDKPAPFDIDAATLRSLSLITGGLPLEFVDLEGPPAAVRRWLRGADLRQTQGLLVETLRRWHELRPRDEPRRS